MLQVTTQQQYSIGCTIDRMRTAREQALSAFNLASATGKSPDLTDFASADLAHNAAHRMRQAGTENVIMNPFEDQVEQVIAQASKLGLA